MRRRLGRAQRGENQPAQRLPVPDLRHPGAGTSELDNPKLRTGSYFPDWLLEPRRRAERALVAVVAQCQLEGVSTRRVEDLVRALAIERLSKSQVSEMARSLDAMVAAFRNRRLDAGPAGGVSRDADAPPGHDWGRCLVRVVR